MALAEMPKLEELHTTRCRLDASFFLNLVGIGGQWPCPRLAHMSFLGLPLDDPEKDALLDLVGHRREAHVRDRTIVRFQSVLAEALELPFLFERQLESLLESC
ncbi:hypothetical protein AURDEDRAFT_115106 [Auricularia subglabra TFB-10046 SS5]|nr:hypothetical protein AURDEDRAFT_115106 [Auricularia subglabra TFB-10046 SS5]